MAKVGISHCFDMDRLGHAGVKVKWEPVEARRGVNAQADAQGCRENPLGNYPVKGRVAWRL
ncbi:hypothetical protein IPC345_24220 [Pseudomonas aeruginosa]|nr:hypothetical protein IPC345_24220 [Pseudomonas aeruginosa]